MNVENSSACQTISFCGRATGNVRHVAPVTEIGAPEAATVEIVSVAVKTVFRRRGIGRELVEAVARRAAAFSPRELVVLTFAPEFFSSLGFVEVPKTKIMHKLYTGCINCTKHADPFTCPEIAMIRHVRERNL